MLPPTYQESIQQAPPPYSEAPPRQMPIPQTPPTKLKLPQTLGKCQICSVRKSKDKLVHCNSNGRISYECLDDDKDCMAFKRQRVEDNEARCKNIDIRRAQKKREDFKRQGCCCMCTESCCLGLDTGCLQGYNRGQRFFCCNFGSNRKLDERVKKEQSDTDQCFGCYTCTRRTTKVVTCVSCVVGVTTCILGCGLILGAGLGGGGRGRGRRMTGPERQRMNNNGKVIAGCFKDFD